eukprot:761508-Hanusia_phi.AAC.11
MNAYGRMHASEVFTREVFGYLDSCVLPQLSSSSFNSTSIAIVLNSCAKAGIRADVVHRLLVKLRKELDEDLQLDGRQIASLLHAIATLNLQVDSYYLICFPPLLHSSSSLSLLPSLTLVQEECILDRLVQSLLALPVESLLPEEIALISWSSAVLNVQVPPPLPLLFRLPSPRFVSSPISSSALSSLRLPSPPFVSLLASLTSPAEASVCRVAARGPGRASRQHGLELPPPGLPVPPHLRARGLAGPQQRSAQGKVSAAPPARRKRQEVARERDAGAGCRAAQAVTAAEGRGGDPCGDADRVRGGVHRREERILAGPAATRQKDGDRSGRPLALHRGDSHPAGQDADETPTHAAARVRPPHPPLLVRERRQRGRVEGVGGRRMGA